MSLTTRAIFQNIRNGLQYMRSMCFSLYRQNFSVECESALNKQILLELTSSYEYLAMAFHFHDIGMPGAYKFFNESSEEERKHATQMMEYMNKRGGQIVLGDISAPKCKFETLIEALQAALKLEHIVNESLLKLHSIASKADDPNMCDFIETNYLQEQVDAQKQLADYIRQLERTQADLGTYLFDLNLKTDGSLHN